MKNILVILLTLLILHGNSQPIEEENTVKSSIRDVTVFLNQAHIYRYGSTQLGKGHSMLVFEELSPYINESTLRVKTDGDFLIHSIRKTMDYVRPLENRKEIDALMTQIESLNRTLSRKNAQMKVYEGRIGFLEENKSIGGQMNGINLDDLKEISEYYAQQIMELRLRQVDTSEEIDSLTKEKSRLQNQLSTLNGKPENPSARIILNVFAEKPTKAGFEISYAVSHAGWVPQYDIRVENTDEPIQVTCNAKIYQNTGENWDNVSLMLSNAQPHKSGNAPHLQPWFLDFLQPYYNKKRTYGLTAPSSTARSEAMEEMEVAEDVEYANNTLPTVTVENQTSVEFKVNIPFTVPSDGQHYTVSLQDIEVPSSYEYITTPKLDPAAYLIARITDWEEHNFLKGQANLFFENTYVGKTTIDPKTVKDTLSISLGQDPNVVVTRERIQDYEKDIFLSSSVIEHYAWTLSVRNKKRHSVKITVYDQVPLSSHSDIDIEAGELSGGKLNKNTGIVQWKFTLDAHNEKDWVFGYNIKYPKDKTLALN